MIHRLTGLAGIVLTAAVLSAFADAPARQAQGLPSDLGTYRHIGSIVVPDSKSPVMGFHHFYVNDRGLKTFYARKKGAEYPAGTVFVGKVYQPRKTEDGAYNEGDLLAYTLMRKAPDDPATKDTGGWEFVKFDAQGKRVKINPVADCFHCHQPHKATDYVMSVPLEPVPAKPAPNPAPRETPQRKP